MCVSQANKILLIFLSWDFNLRHKDQAHSIFQQVPLGMGGPGACGCLRRLLSGWEYFKKNVCGRDLRISQNSKQSIWISVWKNFYKCFKGRKQKLQGPISQLPQLPCGVPIDFKDLPGLHPLWAVDPGKKWTKDGEKKGWTGERGSFVDTLIQKSDPFF